MRILAGEDELVPALTLRIGDDADGLALVLEDRALLDVRLEEGVHRPSADRLRAVVADPLQFLAHGLAVDIGAREAVLEREDAGIHARGDHRRCEAGAFLVGPDRGLDRPLGLDAEVVERAQHLEAGEHAVDAVETATGGLAVEMAAGADRGEIVVAARAAGEDVAHPVDLHGAAGLLAPLDEEVAALLVEVGQGEPADAALGRRADLRHLHQARPEAVTVDLHVGHAALLRG